MVCERGGLSIFRRGGRTFGGLGLQGNPDGSSVIIFLNVCSLKREQEQERPSLKEGSSLQPLMQDIIFTVQLHQSI